MLDLVTATALLRLLADPTRVRLLALLRARGTDRRRTCRRCCSWRNRACPRTWPNSRKPGWCATAAPACRPITAPTKAASTAPAALLRALRRQRRRRAAATTTRNACPRCLPARARARGWADTVAGDMERHYSPGRTWETLARSLLQLLETGDVLDIASGDGVTGRAAGAARALDRLRGLQRARGRGGTQTAEVVPPTSR